MTCIRVEAEETPEISEHCNVSAVPLLLFYSGGKEVDRLEGADPAALTNKFMSLANAATQEGPQPITSVSANAPPAEVPLNQRIEALVRQQSVMLFMKGKKDRLRY